jgi:protein-S-isoprenylcysteine O-methyltransferase Ste14
MRASDLLGRQWQRKAIMSAAALLGIFLLMVSGSVSPEADLWHEVIERSGASLILIGILGRTWCSIYIDGYKRRKLVTEGPYSVTRNPFYLSSTIAAFGLGAQLGSVTLAVLCAIGSAAIYSLAISHEERSLAERFPTEYALYRSRVPRLLPALRGWRNAEKLLVGPDQLFGLFEDVMLFLLTTLSLKIFENLREALQAEPIFRFY